ncbi:UbiD family decarboxylase [Halorubrum salsamenti]|uniref:UbiD family decarboxylase domain-containing protein n=1 Tax=Halorubrum salsamenti TaxID=2583990 RepID=UPI0011A2CB03|nr:UbiD family decarboxylase domain-containing protein [Halorubrum salsamenti]
MTGMRDHLDRLRETDDVVDVTERVHWDGEAEAVAAEATRHDCPVVRFAETPGLAQLASGVYGGPDQFSTGNKEPWSRIDLALGEPSDRSYVDMLDQLVRWGPAPIDEQMVAEPEATVRDGIDLYDLGLPMTRDGVPLVSLGVLAVEVDDTTTWVPIAGRGRRSTELKLSVPRAFAEWCPREADASVLLGVPVAMLLAALQGWTQGQPTPDVPALAAGLSDDPLSTVDGRTIPADAEVRIDGELTVADHRDGDSRDVDGERNRPATADDPTSAATGRGAAWETGCETATVTVETTAIAARESPTIPFSPSGEALADDIHLACLAEAAKLFRRVNNYWGVSPVRWIQIPVEGRLGLCIVSSEILYAGFEWQLANTLFSFSDLFDKVLIVDEQVEPTDLARALDDMWVKAHPANDWVFSESNAPSAAAPAYRDDDSGSRLYINATWDPRWDEEYIAPRVTMETAFSENVLASLADRWDEFGLDDAIRPDRFDDDE